MFKVKEGNETKLFKVSNVHNFVKFTER